MTATVPAASSQTIEAMRDIPLTRSSPEPLYRQLAQQIETAIRHGTLKPDERLDSEAALAQRFAVSRITVRQAVDALASKQLVIRKQGKGTFVTQPTVKHDLRRLHGLLGSLFAQAAGASAKLLRFELVPVSREIADALALRPGARALRLDRLYEVEARPVALARAWLTPQSALPRASAELLSTEDIMRAAGIRIASAHVSIRAEAAGATVGRLLRLSARAPLLVLRRTALGADGKAKEIGRIWFRSDAYELVCASDGAAEALFDIRNVEKV